MSADEKDREIKKQVKNIFLSLSTLCGKGSISFGIDRDMLNESQSPINTSEEGLSIKKQKKRVPIMSKIYSTGTQE